MFTVKIERISQNQAIISLEALNTLIDVAKKVDEIEIDEIRNDLPIEGLMMLEETSGAFDFLKDEKEDIYTVDDLKVRYR
ncbi:hypothetical protein H8E77_14930 [bacterium]|nr:hypothetical protein [bacterium]